MYRELTVNSDTDLVKLLWDTFPDLDESEIQELVDGGWVKVGYPSSVMAATVQRKRRESLATSGSWYPRISSLVIVIMLGGSPSFARQLVPAWPRRVGDDACWVDTFFGIIVLIFLVGPSQQPYARLATDKKCHNYMEWVRGQTEICPFCRWHSETMHTTRTIDYAIVLSGEVHLKSGDSVVQRATRHGWYNRGDMPCSIAFILINSPNYQ